MRRASTASRFIFAQARAGRSGSGRPKSRLSARVEIVRELAHRFGGVADLGRARPWCRASRRSPARSSSAHRACRRNCRAWRRVSETSFKRVIDIAAGCRRASARTHRMLSTTLPSFLASIALARLAKSVKAASSFSDVPVEILAQGRGVRQHAVDIGLIARQRLRQRIDIADHVVDLVRLDGGDERVRLVDDISDLLRIDRFGDIARSSRGRRRAGRRRH